MSRASLKISTSGLRMCTKQEDMKQSTNLFSLNFSNPICIEFAPFIADDDDLQSQTVFKLRNQIDHLWKRL